MCSKSFEKSKLLFLNSRIIGEMKKIEIMIKLDKKVLDKILTLSESIFSLFVLNLFFFKYF